MGQLIGVSIGGPYVGIVVLVIVIALLVAFRLYRQRRRKTGTDNRTSLSQLASFHPQQGLEHHLCQILP